MSRFDAVVIGSGPNGLAAAVHLARNGYSVHVVEGHEEIGGGTRTSELTRPGFRHDVCSAIHPMGMASPFLKTLPLAEFGLEWIHPEIPLAHPFDDGSAAVLFRSVDETAGQFDSSSAAAYRRVIAPLVERCDDLLSDLLAPPQVPRSPLLTSRFGMAALPAALDAARCWFSDERARGLLAGNAAHAVMPLDRILSTNAIGLMLMIVAHAYGWPVARGGSGAIARALAAYLESLGGRVETGRWIRSLEDLPEARVYLFDTAPRHLEKIAGEKLPRHYRRGLRRYRHGPGIFKVDYALSEPVPWTAEACRKAGTVHVGGTIDEIARAEREAWEGHHSERPFVLTAQQSVCDSSRAPNGQHTFWAYCHVPHGSNLDQTRAIENQLERFAPGFRNTVLERHVMNCDDYERYNPNLVGGDIVGGVADWTQLLTRPVPRLRPHTTPNPKFYLCSASTPPGAGVHGMGGFWAAEEAVKQLG